LPDPGNPQVSISCGSLTGASSAASRPQTQVPEPTERRGSPSPGEDNEHVDRCVLGLDDDEGAELVAAGIAARDDLDREGNPA
jgi:hypothetical protein